MIDDPYANYAFFFTRNAAGEQVMYRDPASGDIMPGCVRIMLYAVEREADERGVSVNHVIESHGYRRSVHVPAWPRSDFALRH